MSATINFYGPLFSSPDITPAIARAAHVARVFGQALIKAKTPVDTGKLKSDWKVKLEGQGLRITNAAPYAGFVEFGTVKMAARSMMTSSLPEIQAVFVSELYSDIGKELGADLVGKVKQPNPSYSNAVAANPAYPSVGKKLVPTISTGLSKRTAKTSQKYLFSRPNDILSKTQKARTENASPLLQRRR